MKRPKHSWSVSPPLFFFQRSNYLVSHYLYYSLPSDSSTTVPISPKRSNHSLLCVCNYSKSAMDIHQSLEAANKKSSSKNVTVRSSVVSKFTKENLSPCFTSSKIRPPLLSNSVIGNLSEFGMTPFSATSLASFDDGTENIDSEIESIEKEIGRLTLRLEFLRLEKMKRISVKSAAALKRGRFVPAKFKDRSQPPSTGKLNPRKLESKIAKQKTPVGRKAISLGPAEIYSATKLKRPGNRQEFTPVNKSQSRRKSCFWKIEEVDELKLSPELGKTTASKLQSQNSKSSVKEDELTTSSIQPKELFKEGDKSVTAKKPSRSGRMVSSRYMCSNGDQAHLDSSAPNSSRKRSMANSDNQSNKKRISRQSEAFE